jgi:hypothetical protein
MSDNGGAKDHHDFPVEHHDLCWDTKGGAELPVVSGLDMTTNLEGMETNTDESKGSPTGVMGMGTGSIHDFGKMTNGTLDESY